MDLFFALKSKFSSNDVTFKQCPAGLIAISVNNRFAKCEVHLQGAHITSFVPHGEDDLLWLSNTAVYKSGKAIRGGIPICWPWFGEHKEDKSKGAHGFARTSQWEVSEVCQNDSDETELTLKLSQSNSTLALWPFSFDLTCTITVGKSLSVSLTTLNTDKKDFAITEALHSYFKVGDIQRVSIKGLDGCHYIDKLSDGGYKQRVGDLNIDNLVDSVYVDSQQPCLMIDQSKNRKIEVSKSGSNSTIIWNPWEKGAYALADMDDDGYKEMVCIESGNALENEVVIAPGYTHRISQTIKLVE